MKLKTLLLSACSAVVFAGLANAETLTIATVNNGDMVRMQGLTEDFTKANPDIQLEWVTLEENVLRERGLSSRDIDSFMRHRVVGLERNTNSQVCVPHQALGRIEATQLVVMREVGIQALAGLRRE